MKSICLASLLLVASGQAFGQSTRKSTDPPVQPRGKLGQDLFLAIDHRDLAGVETLLSRGADPNARNGLEFVPLYIAAASHQTDVMRVLLHAGAKLDASTVYGTPLLFAAASGNVEGADLLLKLGANPSTQRADGMNSLMMAANCGATPIVQALLAHKVNVNVKDDAGETALALAARNGFPDIARLLLAANADVDSFNSEQQTPLMEAAANGRADLVALLLDHRASPVARDRDGKTPLILAASYGDHPDVVRALLTDGANKAELDRQGQTALTLASHRGYAQTTSLLDGKLAAQGTGNPDRAINRSLRLIEASTLQFDNFTGCVSCHQEGIGRIATGEAQSHGFTLDAKAQRGQIDRINQVLMALDPIENAALKNPEATKQLPLVEINEVSDTDGWILAGMAAQHQAPNDQTASMAMCLARQQASDGSWTFSVPRVPLQSSFFTFTALAVNALEAYGPKSQASETDTRIERAKAWLASAKPQTSEDRASRLLGLKWAGASLEDRRQAIDDIVADQHSDGGWSQLPGGDSDAYATGQALYALHMGGGISAQDHIYTQGVRFLLRTQDPDGSWYVAKRAIPANDYLDSGFPHGESQYASFDGACWATLALLQTIPTKTSAVKGRPIARR